MNPSPSGASVSGVMIPCRSTEATSSPICSSPKSLRGLKPSAERLQLVVVSPGDPERAPRVRELRLDVRGVTRLPGALRVREREQHPVQTGEPERRNRDRDGEAAVVTVAEAEEREHLLSLRAADPDLAVEPHQRVH